ncbi:unnamed protein product [Schistocephalus solidus]|uniref:Secreted protein n=1 Tax=Schistocephalus solidus TaxID=70667 RepID=A0A183TB83_SCHSO|nr:unnamed protein product [Schistocephalus solidus]
MAFCGCALFSYLDFVPSVTTRPVFSGVSFYTLHASLGSSSLWPFITFVHRVLCPYFQ